MTYSYRHECAKDRAVSARYPRPHPGGAEYGTLAVPRPEGIGRKVAMPSK